MDIGKILSRRG